MLCLSVTLMYCQSWSSMFCQLLLSARGPKPQLFDKAVTCKLRVSWTFLYWSPWIRQLLAISKLVSFRKEALPDFKSSVWKEALGDHLLYLHPSCSSILGDQALFVSIYFQNIRHTFGALAVFPVPMKNCILGLHGLLASLSHVLLVPYTHVLSVLIVHVLPVSP